MTHHGSALQGFGLGLRPQHYERILAGDCAVDWFEILSENYLVPGGRPLYYLDRIAERFPLAMHGVSLSIGSSDPLNRSYLRDLARLARRVQPRLISDHLCWTGVDGLNLHDLMPLPQTDEAVHHVARRIGQVQDALGRQFVIENVSSYVDFRQSAMPEWEFLSEVARRADCGILLDVNNIYVSAMNHGFSPHDYLAGLPVNRIGQMHLAGHSDAGTHLVDTHDHPVPPPVWSLYGEAVRRFGPVSTLVEWDDRIPALEELVAEAGRARSVEAEVLRAYPKPA